LPDTSFIAKAITNELLPSLTRLSRVANSPYLEPTLSTRGVKDAGIYRVTSPSVVLIVTDEGLGTGVIITSSGEVLTDWHVIKGHTDVAVFFKPTVEGQEPTREDMRRGHVIRFDEIADLALVQVDSPPAGRAPVKLGNTNEISIGSDV
jgi:S1-C subfamily serine protease